MIKVHNISVQKGKTIIVKNASFNVHPGKITVVIGKNGAGKSTLFETLTGSNEFQQGDILWEDVSISKLDLQKLALKRAVLSQKIDISFPIKVKELVEMGTYASEKYIPKNEVKNLVQDALESMEMLDFENRDFNTLSGGEQKRALLAKCLVQLNCSSWKGQKKYLFLDEPTANLDIHQQFKFIELVKKLVENHNIGVFAILHDLNLAAQLADEIIIMNSGRVSHKGSPFEVLTEWVLKQSLDINTIIQPHPVLDCPFVTTIPFPLKKGIEKSLIENKKLRI